MQRRYGKPAPEFLSIKSAKKKPLSRRKRAALRRVKREEERQKLIAEREKLGLPPVQPPPPPKPKVAKIPLMYEAPKSLPEENFLILLSRGNSVKIAAAASGLGIKEFERRKKAADKGDADCSTFMEKVEGARAKAVVEHMQVVRQAALAGDYKASIEWLKAFQKEDFSNDNKITIEHKASEYFDLLFQKIQSLLPPDVYEELMEGLRVKQIMVESSEIKDAEFTEIPALPEAVGSRGDR